MTASTAEVLPYERPTERAPARALVEVGLVTGGKIVSLLSMFACGMLVARATGPTEYGLYAAGLAVILFLDSVAGSPWDLAAVRFASQHRSERSRVHEFLGSAFRLKLFFSIGLIVVLLPLLRWISPSVLGTPGRSPVLAIALLSTIALLAVRATATYLQVSFRFRPYAATDALQGLIRLSIVIVAIRWGTKIAEPYLLAYGAGSVIVFFIFQWIVPQPYLRAPWLGAADRRALLRYVGATSITVLVGTVSGKCDVLILAAVRSAREAGIYAAANQLTLLVTLLSSYVAVVVQPRITTLVASEKIHTLLRWNFVVGVLGGGLLTGLTIWLSPVVIPMLFGRAFAPSVPVLQVLAIAMLFDVLQFPVLLPLVLQLYPRATLVSEVAISAAFITAAFFAASHGGIWMAWVAVSVRAAKLGVYAVITLSNIPRRVPISASPVS